MITDQHRAFLNAQAIPDSTLEAAGVRSVTDPVDAPEELQWAVRKSPGILFRWNVPGRDEPVHQFRPDKPWKSKDSEAPMKYVFPKGCGSFTGMLRPPATDSSLVLVVEGTKQSLAARAWAPEDWGVYGVPGCQSWTGSDLSWADGRDVVVLFDKDVTTNRSVYDAAMQLSESLTVDGGAGSVKFARIVNARSKDGLDDVLAARPEDRRRGYLERLVRAATDKLGRAPSRTKTNPYFNKDGGLLARTASEAVLEGQPAALAKGSMIALYRGGVFQVNSGREPLMAAVRALLDEEYRPTWRSTVEESLIGLLSQNNLVLPERLTEPFLNCKNGMLDLRTGVLHAHDPKYLSRTQIPVEWDADAEAPHYTEWLHEYCPGQVDDLEESASVMLDPSRTPAKAVFLFGPSRSGKSTFLRIMGAIAGDRNISGVSLHSLEEDQFATANLYGKMLNVCADLSAAHVADTSNFKKMAGGDLITANRKYGQQFDFTNTALFAFSANRIPTVNESSSAYVERMKPFSFPKSFAGREDPRVEDAILAELPGILVRWVRAWQRREQRGGYLPTNTDVLRSFEAASDRVRMWVDKAAEIHPEAVGTLVGPEQGTGRTDLYNAFKVWLTAEGGAGAMKRADFIARLETVPGVGEVRLRHRNKNLGLNVTVVNEDEKDRQRSDAGSEPTPKNHTAKPQVTASENDQELRVCQTAFKSNGSQCENDLQTQPPTVLKGQNPHRAHFHTPPESDLATALGFDIETASADELFTGEYEGPFVRLVGGVDGLDDFTTCADPEALMEDLNRADVIYGHNIFRFDLIALARHHGADYDALAAKAVDTYVLAQLADPPGAKGMKPWGQRGYYGLDETAKRLGHAGKSDDLKALADEFGGYDKIPVDDERYVEYLRGDLAATQHTYEALVADGLSDYARREMRIAAIQNRMTLNGWKVDTELLAERVAQEDARRTEAAQALADEFGMPLEKTEYKLKLKAEWPAEARSITIWDAREMVRDRPLAAVDAGIAREVRTPYKAPWGTDAGKEALEAAFKAAGAEFVPRTKTGQIALGKDELGEGWWVDAGGTARPGMLNPKAYGHLEGVRRLCELLGQATGASAKYAEISRHVTAEGRVHPLIGKTQGSGRWGTVKPSNTNTGKRGEAGEQRRVWVADEGHVLLTCDLSQVDMRAVAALSQDPAYMALFEPGRDAHMEMAEVYFGERTKEARSKTKAINHGLNYGESDRRVAESNQLPLELVQRASQARAEAFPRLIEWTEEVREIAASGALLDNGFGRLMRPDPARAYTQGPALKGQGAARDIMCESLLRLIQARPDVTPYLRGVVHDEVIGSFPEDQAEEWAGELGRAFTWEWRGVPILCEVSDPGRSWADCID